MPLTEEVVHTQFDDKVDEYNTLEHTKHPQTDKRKSKNP